MMSIEQNLDFIKNKVKLATEKSPYKNKVEIIAATKTHPFSTIFDSYKAGIRSIGENRIQEAIQKFGSFETMLDMKKRFIGHLQSNKVKKCVNVFDTIDSVHSLKLLKKINKELEKKGKKIPILLQININGEKQKSGFMLTEKEYIIQCFDYKNVKIQGFMTIAPFTKDKSLTRRCFIQLREFMKEVNSLIEGKKMTELSMGMSGDYEIAIEEGATQVRLGTSIFGPRG